MKKVFLMAIVCCFLIVSNSFAKTVEIRYYKNNELVESVVYDNYDDGIIEINHLDTLKVVVSNDDELIVNGYIE